MANTTGAQRAGRSWSRIRSFSARSITEKGTHQSSTRARSASTGAAYSFEVNLWATKTEIKAAVEELFSVRVDKVRTQNRLGKQRRYRFKIGRLSNWKKAIVTLQPESQVIEFF